MKSLTRACHLPTCNKELKSSAICDPVANESSNHQEGVTKQNENSMYEKQNARATRGYVPLAWTTLDTAVSKPSS